MLWIDCDQPDSHHQLHAFSPRPALAVASGSGGTHAYWPLARPVGPDQLERANRRLAQALQADRRSVDAARILRPVGTLNHKHSPPQPVALRWFDDGAVFELDDVLAALPELPKVPGSAAGAGRVEPRGPRGDPLLAIPPTVYVPVLVGTPLNRDRKVCLPVPRRPHALASRLRTRPRLALLRLRRLRLHLRSRRPPLGPSHPRPRLPRAAPRLAETFDVPDGAAFDPPPNTTYANEVPVTAETCRLGANKWKKWLERNAGSG